MGRGGATGRTGHRRGRGRPRPPGGPEHVLEEASDVQDVVREEPRPRDHEGEEPQVHRDPEGRTEPHEVRRRDEHVECEVEDDRGVEAVPEEQVRHREGTDGRREDLPVPVARRVREPEEDRTHDEEQGCGE